MLMLVVMVVTKRMDQRQMVEGQVAGPQENTLKSAAEHLVIWSVALQTMSPTAEAVPFVKGCAIFHGRMFLGRFLGRDE